MERQTNKNKDEKGRWEQRDQNTRQNWRGGLMEKSRYVYEATMRVLKWQLLWRPCPSVWELQVLRQQEGLHGGGVCPVSQSQLSAGLWHISHMQSPGINKVTQRPPRKTQQNHITSIHGWAPPGCRTMRPQFVDVEARPWYSSWGQLKKEKRVKRGRDWNADTWLIHTYTKCRHTKWQDTDSTHSPTKKKLFTCVT